jgi:hypothetical protein
VKNTHRDAIAPVPVEQGRADLTSLPFGPPVDDRHRRS